MRQSLCIQRGRQTELASFHIGSAAVAADKAPFPYRRLPPLLPSSWGEQNYFRVDVPLPVVVVDAEGKASIAKSRKLSTRRNSVNTYPSE